MKTCLKSGLHIVCLAGIANALYFLLMLCLATPLISPTVYIYWGIGGAITNGLGLYTDIFETKPPGIFLLSALSLRLFHSQILGYALQIAILVTVPAAFACAARRMHHGIQKKSSTVLPALLFIVIVALERYILRHPGGWSLEFFGAMACIGYLYFLQWPRCRRWLQICCLSTCILCAVGMKESYFLAIIGVALLTRRTLREFAHDLLAPSVIAGLCFLAILGITGFANGYFSVYLVEMFGHYVARHGMPLWERSMVADRVFRHLDSFFPHLKPVILAFFFLPFFLGRNVRERMHMTTGLLLILALLMPLTALSVEPYPAGETMYGILTAVLLLVTAIVIETKRKRENLSGTFCASGLLMIAMAIVVDPLRFHFAAIIDISAAFNAVRGYQILFKIAVIAALTILLAARRPRQRELIMAGALPVLAFFLGFVGVSLAGDYQGQHFLIMAPIFAATAVAAVRHMAMRWSQPLVRTAGWSLLCFLVVIIVSAPLQHQLLALTNYKENLISFTEEAREIQAQADGIDELLDRCSVDRYLALDGGLFYGLTRHSSLVFYLWPTLDSAMKNFHPVVAAKTIRNMEQAQIAFLQASAIPPGLPPTTDAAVNSRLALKHLAAMGIEFTTDPWPCARGSTAPTGLIAFFRRAKTSDSSAHGN